MMPIKNILSQSQLMNKALYLAMQKEEIKKVKLLVANTFQEMTQKKLKYLAHMQINMQPLVKKLSLIS